MSTSSNERLDLKFDSLSIINQENYSVNNTSQKQSSQNERQELLKHNLTDIVNLSSKTEYISEIEPENKDQQLLTNNLFDNLKTSPLNKYRDYSNNDKVNLDETIPVSSVKNNSINYNGINFNYQKIENIEYEMNKDFNSNNAIVLSEEFLWNDKADSSIDNLEFNEYDMNSNIQKSSNNITLINLINDNLNLDQDNLINEEENKIDDNQNYDVDLENFNQMNFDIPKLGLTSEFEKIDKEDLKNIDQQDQISENICIDNCEDQINENIQNLDLNNQNDTNNSFQDSQLNDELLEKTSEKFDQFIEKQSKLINTLQNSDNSDIKCKNIESIESNCKNDNDLINNVKINKNNKELIKLNFDSWDNDSQKNLNNKTLEQESPLKKEEMYLNFKELKRKMQVKARKFESNMTSPIEYNKSKDFLINNSQENNIKNLKQIQANLINTTKTKSTNCKTSQQKSDSNYINENFEYINHQDNTFNTNLNINSANNEDMILNVNEICSDERSDIANNFSIETDLKSSSEIQDSIQKIKNLLLKNNVLDKNCKDLKTGVIKDDFIKQLDQDSIKITSLQSMQEELNQHELLKIQSKKHHEKLFQDNGIKNCRLKISQFLKQNFHEYSDLIICSNKIKSKKFIKPNNPATNNFNQKEIKESNNENNNINNINNNHKSINVFDKLYDEQDKINKKKNALRKLNQLEETNYFHQACTFKPDLISNKFDNIKSKFSEKKSDTNIKINNMINDEKKKHPFTPNINNKSIILNENHKKSLINSSLEFNKYNQSAFDRLQNIHKNKKISDTSISQDNNSQNLSNQNKFNSLNLKNKIDNENEFNLKLNKLRSKYQLDSREYKEYIDSTNKLDFSDLKANLMKLRTKNQSHKDCYKKPIDNINNDITSEDLFKMYNYVNENFENYYQNNNRDINENPEFIRNSKFDKNTNQIRNKNECIKNRNEFSSTKNHNLKVFSGNSKKDSKIQDKSCLDSHHSKLQDNIKLNNSGFKCKSKLGLKHNQSFTMFINSDLKNKNIINNNKNFNRSNLKQNEISRSNYKINKTNDGHLKKYDKNTVFKKLNQNRQDLNDEQYNFNDQSSQNIIKLNFENKVDQTQINKIRQENKKDKQFYYKRKSSYDCYEFKKSKNEENQSPNHKNKNLNSNFIENNKIQTNLNEQLIDDSNITKSKSQNRKRLMSNFDQRQKDWITFKNKKMIDNTVLKLQKDNQKDENECTFKPQLNQNRSEYSILNKSNISVNHSQITERFNQKQLLNKIKKFNSELKDDSKQCTFRPQLSQKRSTRSESISKKLADVRKISRDAQKALKDSKILEFGKRNLED